MERRRDGSGHQRSNLMAAHGGRGVPPWGWRPGGNNIAELNARFPTPPPPYLPREGIRASVFGENCGANIQAIGKIEKRPGG
jgi:hypothetical protein